MAHRAARASSDLSLDCGNVRERTWPAKKPRGPMSAIKHAKTTVITEGDQDRWKGDARKREFRESANLRPANVLAGDAGIIAVLVEPERRRRTLCCC